jgi:uncharacterized protein
MEQLFSFYDQSRPRVNQIFEQEIDSKFEYHDLRHTLDVVNQVEIIGLGEKIGGSELILLKIAALYHDTGFSKARKNHEEQSVQIFLQHSKNSALMESEKEIICSCILATRMPQNPKTLLESVLCDADLDYLGRSDFFVIGDALHREMLYAGEIQPQDSWNELQIRFLKSHQYKTAYAIESRKKGLEENLSLLQLGLRKEP